jgi:hypothetical protein
MAEWRERVPAARLFWEDIARRVFRDVEATTDLHLPWQVVVHEDEPDWPALPSGVHDGIGGIVLTDVPVPQLGRRTSAFPQVWIETPHTGRSLPVMDDETEATGYLADLVQDDVIEEIHGAWPLCPRHPHPLELHDMDTARPTWRCPKTPDIAVPIGELAELGDSSA